MDDRSLVLPSEQHSMYESTAVGSDVVEWRNRSLTCQTAGNATAVELSGGLGRQASQC